MILIWSALKSRRSREGAWIEISVHNNNGPTVAVAPVRERGLKLLNRRSVGTDCTSLP